MQSFCMQSQPPPVLFSHLTHQLHHTHLQYSLQHPPMQSELLLKQSHHHTTIGCDMGEGYPGTHPGTTHGWNVGRVVRVAGGAGGSPARVRVGGLAKVGYPRVPAGGLHPNRKRLTAELP
ncbi:hypothetical protein M405DRAFT_466803 [Rhizopogon salebrosus TDB-379]|nr:hypothetical protein M405DRAFT_466803 [Rhizopogon salebrosus TDB-379]